MKITFIYIDNCEGNQNKFHRGVSVLSACLRAYGHETALVHISDNLPREQIRSLVQATNPDILAFSYISLVFDQIREIAEWTKDLGGFRVHGGVHCTMAPEECIQLPGADAVCVGEGEKPLVELANSLRDGRDIRGIPSIWVRTAEGIAKNSPGPLCENLDDLPFPDYALFPYERTADYQFFKRLSVQASRGCPYACTYCANNFFHRLYPNRKHYVRRMSVPRLMEEIKRGLATYPELTSVRFFDDTLTSSGDWLEEFVTNYTKEIKLPFSGNDRLETITPEKARMLKAAGCTYLDVGIENGDENIRRKLMRRNVSNETIVAGFRALHDAGIEVNAFNILGFINETSASMLETVKLNAKAKPSQFINAYFHPLPNTAATEICRERGYRMLPSSSLFTGPAVDIQTATISEVRFFYQNFGFLVRLFSRLEKYPSLERAISKMMTSRRFPFGPVVLTKGWAARAASNIKAMLRRVPYLRKIVRSVKQVIRGPS